jgi:hypothetical protein
VAGHPADVGRRPEDVGLGLDVEDVAVRRRDVGEVAARRVQDALGLGRRAARVHDVQRLLGVEGLGLVRSGAGGRRVVPPDVAALGPVDVLAGAPDDEHGADVGALLERLVDVHLERRHRPPPVAAVGGDHDPRVGVEDAAGQRLGREAAEDDRVRGTERAQASIATTASGIIGM